MYYIFIKKITFVIAIAASLAYIPSVQANPHIISGEDKPKSISNTDKIRTTWQKSLITPYEVPRAAIYDIEQKPLILKELKGKLVIVYFWATWCLECIKDMITLSQLADELKYRDFDGISILPISIDFKDSKIQQEVLMTNNVTSLQFYIDEKNELSNQMGFNSLPTAFVIAPNSMVIARFNKHLNWNDPTLYKILTDISATTSNNKEIK
jgi:thiol-disulfide isomerase/thioredoxin